MKIVICVYNLFNGGAERVASLWANGFSEFGNEVTLVIAEKELLKDYPLNSKVMIENVWSVGPPIIRYLKKILKLRMILRRLSPDVAIGVMPPWDIWLPLATIGSNVKCINTIHNSFEKYPGIKMKRSEWFHKYIVSRYSTVTTVLTNVDKNIIGEKTGNIFVMPNPLAFKPRYAPKEKEKIILAAGRLDSWFVKGIDVLIKAWANIACNNPEWKLCIAGRRTGGGGKDDPSYIDKLVTAFNLEKQVLFLGYQTNMEKFYSKASIFAFPSRYDGFGMSLIEAMSQGCACVSCDFRGRQREIITHPDEGLICNPDDVEMFSTSLDRLINDTDLRVRLQKGAYKRSMHYTLGNSIGRWLKLFKTIGL